MFDAVYSVLAVNISSSLQSMVSSVTAAGKASSLASVFSVSANVLSSMSKTRADLQKDFLVLASNITRYAGNASMPISGVVQHVQVLHNTWEAVSLAFNTLYQVLKASCSMVGGGGTSPKEYRLMSSPI